MDARRRHRQRRIDRARKGMDEIRPSRIIELQCRPAFKAEMSFTARNFAPAMFVIFDPRAIEAETLLALDLQRPCVSTEVDRIAPAALLFPANRTIAKLIGYGRMALHRKAYRAATARALEFARHRISFHAISGCKGATHDNKEGSWWALTGSNRRPSRCKRDALPTELSAPPNVAIDGRCAPAISRGRWQAGRARQSQPIRLNRQKSERQIAPIAPTISG
jgi:hypothetical protein